MSAPGERGDRSRPDEPQASGGVSTGLTYRVEALVRDGIAGLRALEVTRRFVRLVSEFDPGSYAVVDVRTTDEPGRLEVTLELHGDAALEVTKPDLMSALGEGVFLADPVAAVPVAPKSIRSAYELVRMSVTPVPLSPDDDILRPEWAKPPLLSEGPGFAAPGPNEHDSAEPLLAAMARTDQRLWVRTVLRPADELSRQIVVDDLNSAMTRQGVAEYVRVPVRARTMVVSEARVPVAVRAALRQRGTGLRLYPVDPAEALQLWTDSLAALDSAAVGETHAAAITRIPTAGTMGSLGIMTRPPQMRDRPLDAETPTAEHPIRLGWATDTFGRRADVAPDAADLLRHCFIEGRSGSGKTTTIVQLFWSLTRAGYQVIYLDPHGDGAARAAAYSAALGDRTTYYVRHGDRQHPVRINLLAESDAEMRERMLSELLELIQVMLDPQHEGMVGERFKRTFTLVAQAAFELFGPRTSITDVLALSLTKDALQSLARAVRPSAPDAAARVEAELLSLGDREFAELVSWFVSRLQPFLRTPSLRAIVGTGEDCVDMLDVLNSGKNLIVDLASLELGEDVARVLGALWLLKVRSAMARRVDRRCPVVLLVDEAHLYTFGDLPGLLAQARKFGVGIVVATQAADNLAPRLARAIEANCGSAISLRVGINAAPAASERLGGWPPAQLTRLEDLTAAVSLSLGGVPTQAFTLHIDHFDVVAREGWDEARIASASARCAEATCGLLWAPHADRTVLDDAQVVALVEQAIPRRQPSGSGTATTGSHSTGSSFLDEWLERRRSMSAAATGDDDATPATPSASPTH